MFEGSSSSSWKLGVFVGFVKKGAGWARVVCRATWVRAEGR